MKIIRPFKWCSYSLVTLMIGLSKGSAEAKIHKSYPDSQVDILNVIQAKTPQQLDNYLTWSRTLGRLRIICDAELSNRVIPLSCYRLLKMEERLKILDKPKLSKAMHSLEAFCVNSTENLDEGLWIEPNIERKIGQRCLKHLRERLEIINYKKGMQGAAQDFRNRN